MDFRLSDEQKALQELARDFARNEIEPVSAHHDRTGEFATDIYEKAFELGLMNTHIPEEYGGLGLGVLEGCIIAEEIAAGCSGIYACMEVNSLAEAPLIVAGTDDQKKRFLTPMTEKLTFAAYAVTEPDAGSDVAAHQDPRGARRGRTTSSTEARCGSPAPGTPSWFFVLAYTDPAEEVQGDDRIPGSRRPSRRARGQEGMEHGAARLRHPHGGLRERARAGGRPPGRRRPGMADRHVRLRPHAARGGGGRGRGRAARHGALRCATRRSARRSARRSPTTRRSPS